MISLKFKKYVMFFFIGNIFVIGLLGRPGEGEDSGILEMK